MVVLINGKPYTYPRKKPAGALDEFCETVLAARKEAGNTITPLEARETVAINGGKTEILVVLQREVGAIPGANREEMDKKLQAAATPGTVVLPMARKYAPTKLASIDATTCLICAFRNPETGDVAIAHLDSEKQANDAMVQMLRLINLQFQPLQKPPAAAAESATDDAAGKAVVTIPTVQVSMLGAVKFHEYSPETLSKLLQTLINETRVCFDFRDCNEIAVWTLNADPTTGNCIKHGLMVDNAGNPGVPVDCVENNRGYPAARLRALRSFARRKMDEEQLSSITLFRGEESIVREKNTAEETKQAQQDPEAVLEAAKSAPPPLFKLVVRPFVWPPFVKDAAKKPLEWFLQLSGTPSMEPVDFAAAVKAAVVFSNVFTVEQTFGSADLEKQPGKPLVFVPSSTGSWAQL